MQPPATLPPILSPEKKTITTGLATATSDFLQRRNADPFCKTKQSIPRENQEGCIPGYSGFVRGAQHFYGSTYGKVSRNTALHEFGPDSGGNPVDELPDGASTCGRRGEDARGRLPGYSGYVPGSKFEFAETFGAATTKLSQDHALESAVSPPKPRMLATVTTEMLNGTGTIIIDRPPPLGRDHYAAEKQDNDDGNIPGYSGFVRGGQHFYGSTYGAMTRVSKDYEYHKPTVNGRQPLPSAHGGSVGAMPIRPGYNDVDMNLLPADRPPGYSGHVPLAKFEYANTFGNTCGRCVAKFSNE
ncbi:hypothetical protein M885DRAFT_528091 [Pelagophyceae sp. CCMP2097]|nr:hypothetical protein M885DRAFT_528091 [Pelagophyceae sp. CCMP2097]